MTGFRHHTGCRTAPAAAHGCTTRKRVRAPAVPPIESIRKMMPARDIQWPLDSVWLFHAAGGQFTKLLDRFNTALSTRYGAPKDAEDYTVTSQLMTIDESYLDSRCPPRPSSGSPNLEPRG